VVHPAISSLGVPYAGQSGATRAESPAPFELLLKLTIEGTHAQMGWLRWSDSPSSVTFVRRPDCPILVSTLNELPEPPTQVALVPGSDPSGWANWCKVSGVLSCAVAPVRQDGSIVGSVGLISSAPDVLGPRDAGRLYLASTLAAESQRSEKRLEVLDAKLAEMLSVLGTTLSLHHSGSRRGLYRQLTEALGSYFRASYCRLAVVDSKDRLRLMASKGHRLLPTGETSRPLASLPRCAEALIHRRPVILDFERLQTASSVEREWLFSRATRTGVVLPFFAESAVEGVLVVGEERGRDRQPSFQERLPVLEFVANHLSLLLQLTGRFERQRTLQRRRDTRTIEVAERHRLARELHDEIGQALNGLLVRLRVAMTRGLADADDLRVFEAAAQDAIDAARALAYRVRNPDQDLDPIADAKRYAEAILRGPPSTLRWVDERSSLELGSEAAAEIASVIKESIVNIVRHAKANEVWIRLESPNGKIRVTIRDNGVGFEPREARLRAGGCGLGLIGNAERLKRIGGVFEVKSSPRGTVVIAEAQRMRNGL
jgi:signal transduction histidine kinase